MKLIKSPALYLQESMPKTATPDMSFKEAKDEDKPVSVMPVEPSSSENILQKALILITEPEVEEPVAQIKPESEINAVLQPST